MPDKLSGTGAYLAALTPESVEGICAREINIPFLPFRVGRESRRSEWLEPNLKEERRKTANANNDLYLTDPAPMTNVSREHFLIDRDDEGFFLVERGSRSGTIVEGEAIGGSSRIRRVSLHDHDVIIVGTSLSRFIFKFHLERPPKR